MATQPRLAPSRPPAGATPPLPHPADRRWQLLRLLLVAAVTGSVVAVWGLALRDTDDQPASAGPARNHQPRPRGPANRRPRAQHCHRRPRHHPPPRRRCPARPSPPSRPCRPASSASSSSRATPSNDISVVYGVSIDEILLFNPDLGDGSRVDVGQVVVIPIFEP